MNKIESFEYKCSENGISGELKAQPKFAALPDAPDSPTHFQCDPPSKLPRRRWYILMLFCVLSMSNGYQWIHMSIVANKMKLLYNASLPNEPYRKHTFNMVALLYMIAYIPLIFPVTWLLDRFGLRACVLTGGVLNAAGAWIKCVSTASPAAPQFAVVLLGQTLCGVAQVFILGMPALISSVWFAPGEVGRATSLGVFGNQIGVGLGFVIPPLIVRANVSAFLEMSNENETAPWLNTTTHTQALLVTQFNWMFYAGAILMTLLSALLIFSFDNGPKRAPSLAAARGSVTNRADKIQYGSTMKNILMDKCFILLVLSYGINAGAYYAIGSLLNDILLPEFPGQEKEIGFAGFLMMIAGIVGSLAIGFVMDRFQRYRLLISAAYLLTLVCMLAFTVILVWSHSMPLVYATMFLLGFFMTGYLPLGFEYAAEITYPENQGFSSGYLNASAQLFGILLTLLYGVIQANFHAFAGNMSMCALLLIGSIITAAMKPTLKRKVANIEIGLMPKTTKK